MAQRVIPNSSELAKKIRQRRIELDLTIEEAASKAGVGTKTWSRYESGESIRKDKSRGICKALNWHTLFDPEDNADGEFHLEEYRRHNSYSTFLEAALTPLAAVSFVIGSEIMLDYLDEDIDALSSMPTGSHAGELPASFLASMLPPQFLTRYDYEFLYLLRSRVSHFCDIAHSGKQLIAHSVIDELTLYLIMEISRFSMESIDYSGTEFQRDPDDWDGWAYFIFDDNDLLVLFSGRYIDSSNPYHFSHWLDNQFWTGESQ